MAICALVHYSSDLSFTNRMVLHSASSRLEGNPRYARLCCHGLRALVFFFRVIMTHGRTDIHFGRHRPDVLETTTDVRSRS